MYKKNIKSYSFEYSYMIRVFSATNEPAKVSWVPTPWKQELYPMASKILILRLLEQTWIMNMASSITKYWGGGGE